MAIKVSISNPHSLLTLAMRVIEKLRIKNKLSFDLEVVLDYQLSDYDGGALRGLFYPNDNKIYVNPIMCGREYITSDEQFSYCYTNDLSIFGVTIHEFCHFLTYEVYNTMMKDYKKLFPVNRLYLNDYSDHTIEDEVAEAMTLYITNPFLLKMISKDVWSFFKEYFLSPITCSHKQFYDIYQSYPQEIKIDLQTRWNIVYNIESDRFVKC